MENRSLACEDLGRMSYAQAWDMQCQFHEKVLKNKLFGAILLVEHDPVITLSHRKTVSEHLLADPQKLTQLGIDLQPTNRGGDITYHGPGQLVAYPILRLNDFKLTVGPYMRLLEQVVINTLETFNVTANRESDMTGVWTQKLSPPEVPPEVPREVPWEFGKLPRPVFGGSELPGGGEKICALGVRVKRGISLHGLALNVAPDMSHFQTIVPCGIQGRSVTSLKQCLGESCPKMLAVKCALVKQFSVALGCEIDYACS